MKDTELYARIPGLQAPWTATEVAFNPIRHSVSMFVTSAPDWQWCCPQCGQSAPRYDKRVQQWRQLDTMRSKTLLEAEVPRVRCLEHGVLQVRVPAEIVNSKIQRIKARARACGFRNRVWFRERDLLPLRRVGSHVGRCESCVVTHLIGGARNEVR